MNTGETIALIKAFGNGGGGGGGSSLPAVTSSDNGKVLAVKDGAWAADANLFVVNVTLNQSYSLVADKTYAEISAAIDAGKQIVCVRDAKVYSFASKTSSNIYFADLHPNTSVLYISISSSNTVSTRAQYQLSYASAQDNGSEMIVKNGAWTMQKKKFIVTLTPTSPDYSGTMDKTVAEINAAYEAGQEIVFKLQTSASSYIEVPVQLVGHDSTVTYPSFETTVVQAAANLQVFAKTGTTDDGTKQTYSTTVYALTPAS